MFLKNHKEISSHILIKILELENNFKDNKIQSYHFTKEKTGSERGSNLPKFTQLTGRPELRCLSTILVFLLLSSP